VEYPAGAFHRSLMMESGRHSIAVAAAFDAAVQIPVDRAVTAMPEAEKVRRLSERSAA
jgi:hypothetical protein